MNGEDIHNLSTKAIAQAMAGVLNTFTVLQGCINSEVGSLWTLSSSKKIWRLTVEDNKIVKWAIEITKL